MDFIDQVVVVTGAGNGIGRGVAKAYSEKGAKVIIADVDGEAGQKLEKELTEKGRQALFVETDVRKPEEITRLMKQTTAQFGQINILINNAGVSRWKSPYELTVEGWDDILNINLRASFLCVREAAKIMRNNERERGGSIVNIASTRAFMSEIHSEAYAASKGGIVALTHALAISLGADNIRVNAISPGWIETNDYQSLRTIDHQQHPVNRVGRTQDIAKACFYLTDPENDFVTGENIIVDGGMTRKMIYEH